jgi:hypothetical protein
VRGGFGFFCGNRKNFTNCLDEGKGDKNEQSLINSKEWLEILKIGRGPQSEKVPPIIVPNREGRL